MPGAFLDAMWLLKSLILPPLCGLLPLLVGLLLLKRRPRLGRLLAWSGCALLWLTSTPAVAALLMALVPRYEPLEMQRTWPERAAVVVLSAGFREHAPEYGGPAVDEVTMRRLRYGVRVAKASGLPLLVSGGVPSEGTPSLAALMADAATTDLGLAPRWLEERSLDTFGNAVFSAELLREQGIDTAVLVTDALHMARSVASFEDQGMQVLPAPTAYPPRFEWSLEAFVPEYKSVAASWYALHELLGRAWYEVARFGADR